MRATADPRRRRSPGDGATLVGVKRLRQILVSRPRQAPDGHKQGGTQPTNISMINRRGYWLRLLHGSVSYDHITHSRSGPGPPTPNARGLDIDLFSDIHLAPSNADRDELTLRGKKSHAVTLEYVANPDPSCRRSPSTS